MNNDFEKRLQRITPREIPSAWREEILASARRESASRPAPRATIREFLCRCFSTFVPLPRVAWTGVAAAWMMILVLNLSGGPEATALAAVTPIAIDQTRLALKQKQLLLSELAGRTETTVQPPPTPGPRSQRREEASVS